MERIKELLRKIVPYRLRANRTYRHSLHGPENEKRLLSIEIKLRQKERINVLFIVSVLSMWKGQKLYELLSRDPSFNVRLIISPFRRYTTEEGLLHVKALQDYFTSLNLIVPSTTDDGFDLDAWLDDFKPDVLFPPQHYESLHGNRLDIEYNQDKLLCYIPYGVPTMQDQFVYNLPTHNLGWRIYHATDLHLKTARRLMCNRAINVRIVGDPDSDSLFTGTLEDPWKKISDGKKRKRIIWAPHFSIGHSGYLQRATFLWLCDKMVELAQEYSDEVQFVFKPHPHLHSVLNDLEGWGRQKTDEYYNLWATMPNTQIEQGPYQAVFAYSDGMIHDCGSFTGQYMYVKKPVMFMTKDIDYIRKNADDFGTECINRHYIGSSPEDAEHFIKDVILGNRDDLKDSRNAFFDRYLKPKDGRTVAENIYNDLKNSLR